MKGAKTEVLSLSFSEPQSQERGLARRRCFVTAVNMETQTLLFSVIFKIPFVGNVSLVIFLLGFCRLPLISGPPLASPSHLCPPLPSLPLSSSLKMQAQTGTLVVYSCRTVSAFNSALDSAPSPPLQIQKQAFWGDIYIYIYHLHYITIIHVYVTCIQYTKPLCYMCITLSHQKTWMCFIPKRKYSFLPFANDFVPFKMSLC